MSGDVGSEARRALAWKHGVVAMEALGAMIGPAVFLLPGGRQVCPLHIAPWCVEPEAAALDGLMAGLRGEWPCAPFGYPMPPAPFPPAWRAVMAEEPEFADPHGYGANHSWRFVEAEGALAAVIDYPPEHDLARLERAVRPDPEAAALDIELTLHARRPCRAPVALHGCFRLPVAVGAARLEPGRFAEGLTHPATLEPGAALFASDARFSDLSAVPARTGGTVDAASLPFAQPVEDLLQLNGCDGSFGLLNAAEGYRLAMTWDAALLPSVQLWFSNYGRTAPPWSGRHLCIGIEPCCAPFGLSPTTALAANPIAASGTPTALALSPGAPLTIRYRIALSPA